MRNDKNRSSTLRKFRLMALLVCAPFVLHSTNGFAYTLSDAVFKTLHTHPDIIGTKFAAAASSEEISEARGGLFPSLDVSAGIGREYSNNPATRAARRGSTTFTRRESEFFMRQLLFDGGNVLGTMRQRQFDYDAARNRISEAKERLAFDAAFAYLEILRNRQVLAVRELDVKAHRDLLTKVDMRMKAGAGRKSEVALAMSRLALSEARYEQTQGDLDNSRDTFMKVIGDSAPGMMLDPGLATDLPANLDQAQHCALLTNPTIHVLSAEAAASGAAIGVARSAFFPIFTLDLSATNNNNLDGVPGLNEDAQAMLRMTYNLIRGGSDLAAYKAAKLREQAALEELENVKRDVNEDVAFAWNDMQTAQNRIPFLLKHRNKSLDVYDAYVKQFKLGQRTLFDLLNAQSEYYDARVNYINGRFEQKINSYRVLASIGSLVARFDSV